MKLGLGNVSYYPDTNHVCKYKCNVSGLAILCCLKQEYGFKHDFIATHNLEKTDFALGTR